MERHEGRIRAILAGEPEAVVQAWLALHAWCQTRATGGRLRGAASWSDDDWRLIVSVEPEPVERLRVVGALRPEGRDLWLMGFDHALAQRFAHDEWLEAQRGKRKALADPIVVELPEPEQPEQT